jgi:hypothetical protein
VTDTDLFGNSVGQDTPLRTKKPRPVTNSMDLIERVLKVACGEGYALVGTAERVCRVGPKDSNGTPEITGVPRDEADAVHQLITNKELTVGGQHLYRYRNAREGYGRTVLVPKVTKQKSARLGALHRPRTWSPTGTTARKDT